MSYKRIIRNISHWHEHEIHAKISPLLGYDSWLIGAAKVHSDRVDLTLNFRSRDEYLLCRKPIGEVRAVKVAEL